MSSFASESGDRTALTDALIGQTLGGRLELLELLGTGASSAIYKARHNILNSFVAVKVLSTADPEKIRRFQTEAKALSALKHTNIVSISSFGQEEGRFFLVMDWLPGTTLKALLAEEALSVEEAVHLALEISTAMAYAHSAGILHRDLSSSNVMIVSEPGQMRSARILDFGLSKFLPAAQIKQEDATPPGKSAGNPAYMSPEQCLGTELDERSDIYAFGCLFYEMICGHTPFAGESALDLMNKQVNELPPALSLSAASTPVPAAVRKIIDRCLVKQKQERFSSFDDIVSALSMLSTTVLRQKIQGAGNSSFFSLKSLLLFLALAATVVVMAKTFKSDSSKANRSASDPSDRYMQAIETHNAKPAESMKSILSKHWPSLQSTVRRLIILQKAKQAEAVLEKWLPLHINGMACESISELIVECQAISGQEYDGYATHRILSPFSSLLMRKTAANREIQAQLLKALLGSAIGANSTDPASYKQELIRIRALYRDPGFELQADLLSTVLQTATQFVQNGRIADGEQCCNFVQEELARRQQEKGNLQKLRAEDVTSLTQPALIGYEDACCFAGVPGNAIGICKQHLHLLDRFTQDPNCRALKPFCLLRMSYLESCSGQARAALNDLQSARQLSRALKGTTARLKALCAEIMVLIELEKSSEADKSFAELKRTIGNETLSSKSELFIEIVSMQNAIWFNQHLQVVDWCLHRQLDTHKAEKHPMDVVRCYIELARLRIQEGKFKVAKEILQAARASLKSTKLSQAADVGVKNTFEAKILLLLANAEFLSLNLKEAERLGNEAIVEFRKICSGRGCSRGPAVDLANSIASQAQIKIEDGNLAEAYRLLSQEAAILDKLGQQTLIPSVDLHTKMADLLHAEGKNNQEELDEAFALLKRNKPAFTLHLLPTIIRFSESSRLYKNFQPALASLQMALATVANQKNAPLIVARETIDCCRQATAMADSFATPQEIAEIRKLMQSEERNYTRLYGEKSAACYLLLSTIASLHREEKEGAAALREHQELLARCRRFPPAAAGSIVLANLHFELGQDFLALNNLTSARQNFALAASNTKGEASVIALDSFEQMAAIELISGNLVQAERYNTRCSEEFFRLRQNLSAKRISMIEQRIKIVEQSNSSRQAAALREQLRRLKAHEWIERNE